ncbi:MAG: ATP-binding cassette domain-containing protein [Gemmatimonadaceae bacterium]
MNSARPDGAAALSLVGIRRRFDRVVALDDATMQVRPGTVHALLGENGAGKTTLMRVAFGLTKPDAGSIELAGTLVRFSSPAEALDAGMAMVHQHFTLVPAMTVAENVALGGRGRYSAKEWAVRVRTIGENTGLILDPRARVSDLSVGAQQRCEIVKALARDVRVLILDEPTAVLAPSEAQKLLRWVKRFAEQGHAVVLITHKLRDAMAIASDVTVLRLGKTVLSTSMLNTSESELATAMLGSSSFTGPFKGPFKGSDTLNSGFKSFKGSDTLNGATNGGFKGSDPLKTDPLGFKGGFKGSDTLNAKHETARNESARVVLQTKAASVRAAGVTQVNRVSLAVRAGEIVGIAAVEGAGQRELLRLLSGRLRPSDGSVQLPARIGFVPEDRHNDALMLDRSLVENVALRDAGSRRGRMPWPALLEDTQTIIRERSVRTDDAGVEARTLSGGNQQKLILGRELSNKPDALVVENPTRGLDFRAASDVHDALRAARAAGTAIVVYSSDLDEVLALADRVMVMHEGALREVAGDRDLIGRAMLGADFDSGAE